MLNNKKAVQKEKHHAYYTLEKHRTLVTIIIAAALVLICIWSSLAGASEITLNRILATISDSGRINAKPLSQMEQSVLINIRICRVAAGIIIGAGLALSGCIMQAITGNHMASPFTTGISSAAAFGASVAILSAGSGSWTIILLAFTFSVICTIAVYGIAALRQFQAHSLILMGIAVNYLFSSMTSALQYFANEQQLQSIVYWTFGSLSNITWKQNLLLMMVFLLTASYFFTHARDYSILSTAGDESAASLGVNVKALRSVSGILVALLAASIVSFSGVIGFVGLVAPHISRYLVGGNYKHLLPVTLLTGSVLVLAADTIGRTIISPVTIPVGVVVSLIGVPVFIILILFDRGE